MNVLQAQAIIIRSKTQQHPVDILVEAEFLKAHNAKHLVEVGSCEAGWPLAIEQIIDKSLQIEFTLVENFKGSEFVSIADKPIERKKEILSNYIKRKSETLNFTIVEDNYIESIGKKYDVLRYDAYSSYEVFKDYIDAAEENALIIIHDQNFYNEFLLSLYITKYMMESNLYPVYLGALTGIYTKSKDYKIELLDKCDFDNLLNEQERIRFLSADKQRTWDNVFENIDIGSGFYTFRA